MIADVMKFLRRLPLASSTLGCQFGSGHKNREAPAGLTPRLPGIAECNRHGGCLVVVLDSARSRHLANCRLLVSPVRVTVASF